MFACKKISSLPIREETKKCSFTTTWSPNDHNATGSSCNVINLYCLTVCACKGGFDEIFLSSEFILEWETSYKNLHRVLNRIFRKIS
ncbi:MAG: hypothetical protein FD174_1209 [Geobacteraceae bacterium]|nr:MAG: hypothetical protein FD174_1209 [Geobacteraceae bacterium]